MCATPALQHGPKDALLQQVGCASHSAGKSLRWCSSPVFKGDTGISLANII